MPGNAGQSSRPVESRRGGSIPTDVLTERLRARTDRTVEAELEQAFAAMERAEGSLSPTQRRVIANLAARIADETVAPAQAGLTSADPAVREHAAPLFDLDD